VLVLTLGGGKGSSGAKGALDKLLNAAKNHDLKTAQSLTCAPLSDELMTSPLASATNWKIGDAHESGDTATVPFSATVSGGEKNYTASAQKQNGTWKICGVAEGGSGGGGGGDAAAAEQTVQRLLQAGKDRDLDAARALSCEPLRSRIKDVPDISTFTVGTGTASGTSATVPFTVTSEGETIDEVADLQQQSGSWKVCDFHGTDEDTGGGSGLPTLPSEMPTDSPTDLPSFPTSRGSTCFTPSGETPICIP
jgi:hypothetical protein